MSNPDLDITVKDRNAFDLINSFKIQGMLLAVGRQNARILANLNSTNEEEEFEKFLQEASGFTTELPYIDPNVTVVTSKE